MLTIENVSVYHGEICATEAVSMAVAPGVVTTIIGSNGAGKTSLLKAISGLYKIRSGQVLFFGENIANRDPAAIVFGGIVQVPEGRELFPRMSVYDNLLVGGHLRPRQERQETLKSIFNYFPVLFKKRSLLAKRLSGGEQQMLAFGRAMMAKPKFLLLDEPSTGLSPLAEKELMSAVTALAKKEGIGILLVEQNASLALSVSTYAYVLENGTVVIEGTAEELSDNEKVRAAYLGL